MVVYGCDFMATGQYEHGFEAFSGVKDAVF
jgi:hypothetical protein